MDNATAGIGLVWIWLALLSGGYARTRGRGAWAWFVWTLVFGPFAALLLVTWPPVEKKEPEKEPVAR
ncbi:hypothetical protein [Gryllotalpicola protaetiae]|uniref:Cardiolipin synthase N-terminal domain-containing protein n=1 Tax=Gryllotalpicola protaetiae TaxID=2419771 RepID=A0A387BQS4_9MICO|nr:hypothetical protein [Gryllotalpicola protaetiae]AYG04902.1 hypothetical protein D7I44_16140 [Gryllotalpicola protaetiae]